MVQPLRKKKTADDSLYHRRREVEREIEKLEKLKLSEVLALAKKANDTVSLEAIVYLLRRVAANNNAQEHGVDGLISILISRVEVMVKRHVSLDFDETQREEIYHDVIDRIIDDIVDRSDKADYAEINFNHWLQSKRNDACNKQLRKIKRMERAGDAIEDLAENEADILTFSNGEEPECLLPTPLEKTALQEAHAKAMLPSQIEGAEFTPEDQYRIASILREVKLTENILEAFLLYYYWSVPIDSKDPGRNTLVKHFGKSEKTIRIWLRKAEQAFAELRGENDEDE